MHIALQDNAVLIRTDFMHLRKRWMSEFLLLHAKDMLFLPKGVLLFNNKQHHDAKHDFFRQLYEEHAKTHEMQSRFFLRSLLRCMEKPIKIELTNTMERELVCVTLQAHEDSTVTASLYAPNPWVQSYLKSQLEHYLLRDDAYTLLFDMQHDRAKARLERALNRRHLLHYSIEYQYDSLFMSRLYNQYAHYEENEEITELLHYYKVLECPVGANQDVLKKSYKKLVKIYHPDKIHYDSPDRVDYYTQKFQLLQEAYTALRIVS